MHTTHKKRTKLATGHWWRFDKYEIRDNYIRPAKGAKLRAYDPWEKQEEATYRSVISLTKQLGIDDNVLTQFPAFRYRPWFEDTYTPRPLEGDAEALILNWCKEYGLLGMLLQQARDVTFDWRWDLWKGKRPNPGSMQTLYPTVYQHVRQAGRWETIHVQVRRPTLDDPKRQGEPAEASIESPLEPGVMWEDEHFQTFHRTTLGPWAQFFPDVPRQKVLTYNYPKPLSLKFWQLYAEPVSAFVCAALNLRYAIWCLSRRKHLKTTKDESYWMEEGMRIIRRVVAPVSPTAELSEEGALRQRWSSPSLLGSFAMMALQDLASERLRQCVACGKFFTSHAYQKIHCSKRCCRTQQQRRYRKRKVKKTMMQAKKRTKKRSALS